MDKGSIFSTFSSALDTICIFDSSHASRCGAVSHSGFDLHISDGPCKEYYTVKINWDTLKSLRLIWENIDLDWVVLKVVSRGS